MPQVCVDNAFPSKTMSRGVVKPFNCAVDGLALETGTLYNKWAYSTSLYRTGHL